MRRAALVGGAALCLASVAWIVWGPAASERMANNADVVAGITAPLGLLLVVVGMAGSRAGGRGAGSPVVAAQLSDAAQQYLAVETLRYWREQARTRGITTPSPVAVRWGWASSDVAAPATDVLPAGRVLDAGAITELRQQVYDVAGDTGARLVLRGGPGAGKTAAMLLLLVDVLAHRARDSTEPVPVWLSLGSWDPETPLRLWAADTLQRDYPALGAAEHGGPGGARELLRTGRVALFLDGLDELPPALQGAALTAIDTQAVGLRVVLTSRPQEYEDAVDDGRLHDAAVVDLLPVQLADAARFLLAQQREAPRRAWQEVLDHLHRYPRAPLAAVFATPLGLSLAREAYAVDDPRDLLAVVAPTPHLLERTLVRAYPHPRERDHALYWLTWIAQQLGEARDLPWWDIPKWRPTPRLRDTVRFSAGALVGLAVGLAADRLVELVARIELTTTTVFTLVFSFTFGLFTGRDVPRTPTAAARAALTPPALYRIDRRFSLTVAVVAGLTAGLVVGLVAALTFGSAVGRAAGLVAGVAAGLLAAVLVGLTAGLVSGLAVRLLLVEIVLGARPGVPGVRFMRLLETAAARQVLRQSGAVYQFRHAALQDYLATRPPEDAAPAPGYSTGPASSRHLPPA